MMRDAAVLAGGVFFWTFLEYALHNWVGHMLKGRVLPSREHLQHHTGVDYFTPWWRKLLFAVPILSALAGLGSALLSARVGVAFALGVSLGWLAYERVHRMIHVRGPRNAYDRWTRRHHLYHHFHNPKMNHGVTSPLWDMVFGTYQRPTVIRVPTKLAPKLPWLLDDGVLAARYAGDYAIGR